MCRAAVWGNYWLGSELPYRDVILWRRLLGCQLGNLGWRRGCGRVDRICTHFEVAIQHAQWLVAVPCTGEAALDQMHQRSFLARCLLANTVAGEVKTLMQVVECPSCAGSETVSAG